MVDNYQECAFTCHLSEQMEERRRGKETRGRDEARKPLETIDIHPMAAQCNDVFTKIMNMVAILGQPRAQQELPYC